MQRPCVSKIIKNSSLKTSDYSSAAGNSVGSTIDNYVIGYDICSTCWDTSCPKHPINRQPIRPCEKYRWPWYPYDRYLWDWPWTITW